VKILNSTSIISPALAAASKALPITVCLSVVVATALPAESEVTQAPIEIAPAAKTLAVPANLTLAACPDSGVFC